MTETLFASVEKKIDQAILDKKLPVLGAFVLWSFNNVEITVADLKALCARLGLNDKHVPTPEPRGALTDAVKSLRIKCRVARHKVDSERFAISFDQADLHQNGSATVDVSYKVEQVVEYSFKTKALTFQNTFMEPEIRSAFQKYLTTLQSQDVRQVVLRTLEDSHAVAVLSATGTYFVAAQYLDVTAKLRALCDAIPGCAFRAPRILDTPEDRSDMLKSAGAEIEKQLADAEADVAEVLERVKTTTGTDGKHSVRKDTFDRRIEAFGEIREKARAYADLLQFKSETVTERLEALQAQIMEHLV